MFDPAGDKTRRYADRGLDEFGPFDSEGFTPKRPSIAVVTPAAFKGTVETFISSFLDGVPGGVFAKGFVRKYHLGACDVTFEAFDSGPGDVAAYQERLPRRARKTGQAGPGVRDHQRGAGASRRGRQPVPGLRSPRSWDRACPSRTFRSRRSARATSHTR